MNEKVKNIFIFCSVGFFLFAAGLCTGYFWNKCALDRAKSIINEASAVNLELANRLESSQRIIDELRRENQGIRNAIDSGLERAGEIADITERCLEIIGIIEKLLDSTGSN